MTKEEIIKNNTLIADFMGWVHHQDKNYDAHEMTTLMYHKSWDWLMPVFIKIMQWGKDEYGVQWSCEINEQMVFMNGNKSSDFKACHFYGRNELTVHSLYTTIVDFIQWYNQTKTEHEK